MKVFRDRGAIGALLDEYERAIVDLQKVIAPLSAEQLTRIVDQETKDPDCRSIQTILTHVVRAGYCYVIGIRQLQGENLELVERKTLDSIEAYQEALQQMFQYNEALFEDYPDIQLEESDVEKKIRFDWGQTYDVEQLFEHAIVHVLRHRRQIERFLLK